MSQTDHYGSTIDSHAPTLGYLHTSPVHVPTFDALTAEHDTHARARHVVDEALLERARAEGISDGVQHEVRAHIAELRTAGATVVVCTCSTIAGVAETLSTPSEPVIRIDRPMMAAAVTTAEGGVVHLLAALESALPPGVELLEEEVGDSGIEVRATLIPGAWSAFEAGDPDRYTATIAAAIDAAANNGGDVIVLAQASMAGAVAQAATSVPVLSSPSPAVAAALAAIPSI